MATIRGYRLYSYLTCENSPQKFRSEEDEVLGIINPEFANWEKQDQLLMSWILASMSEALHNRMVGCTTSSEIWKRLEVFFSSQSRARVKQLKVQLRCFKKEAQSVSSYLLAMKKIVDSLAAVGNHISIEEHIEAIFDGLGEEYDSFVTFITSRLDPYSVEKVEASLMAQEERIKKHRLATVQANFSQLQFKKENFNPGRGYRGRNPWFRGRSSFSYRGNRNQRGKGRWNYQQHEHSQQYQQ